MKLGMSGTQRGLSETRKKQVENFISENDIEEAHHGDCIGADYDFHQICVESGIKTVIHPPNITVKRAYCKGDIILEPKPFLTRNKDIVNSTDFLIALPATENELLRSGTWATIRAARKLGKSLLIILPNGKHIYE